jgi:hypothetical protein
MRKTIKLIKLGATFQAHSECKATKDVALHSDVSRFSLKCPITTNCKQVADCYLQQFVSSCPFFND